MKKEGRENTPEKEKGGSLYEKLRGLGNRFAGKYKFVLLVGAIGLVLLIIPIGTWGDRASPKETAAAVQPASDEVFLKQVETQLTKVLACGSGVGRVEVMLTLQSSAETVYAQSYSEDGSADGTGETSFSRQSEPSLAGGSGGGQSPIYVKSLGPVFRGAIVICDGADSSEVRLWVTNAVASVTGLGTDKITVIKMKSGNSKN